MKYEALGRRLWFVSFVVALACGSTVAQGVRTIEHEDALAPVTDVLVLIELQGFVSAPGGEPVQGAVVVSSAGGKAVTDAAGAYRLARSDPRARRARDRRGRAGARRGRERTVVRGFALGSSAAARARARERVHAQLAPDVRRDGHQRRGIRRRAVPELYAASAGGVPANRIARWDGSRWKPLGTADARDVNNVAKRVGSSFTGFGTGLSGSVRAVALYDDGTGPALYAGGDFVTAEGGSRGGTAPAGTTSAAASTRRAASSRR